jgi:hypothetical protein
VSVCNHRRCAVLSESSQPFSVEEFLIRSIHARQHSAVADHVDPVLKEHRCRNLRDSTIQLPFDVCVGDVAFPAVANGYQKWFAMSDGNVGYEFLLRPKSILVFVHPVKHFVETLLALAVVFGERQTVSGMPRREFWAERKSEMSGYFLMFKFLVIVGVKADYGFPEGLGVSLSIGCFMECFSRDGFGLILYRSLRVRCLLLLYSKRTSFRTMVLARPSLAFVFLSCIPPLNPRILAMLAL